MGPFNILICRNLLIYYSLLEEQRLLRVALRSGCTTNLAPLLRMDWAISGECGSQDEKSFVLITAGDCSGFLVAMRPRVQLKPGECGAFYSPPLTLPFTHPAQWLLKNNEHIIWTES